MTIRNAGIKDVSLMLAIYAPYVEHTAITFEYTVPSEDEFLRRFHAITENFPWLVAEEDGKILGYAYASRFKERDAYQWAVETSIYVADGMRRRGVGRALHDKLQELLQDQGILNMNACISYIDKEDEYLTQDSVRFHERLGYTIVAHFHQCGKKFGRWYDMVWMEKIIGEHL